MVSTIVEYPRKLKLKYSTRIHKHKICITFTIEILCLKKKYIFNTYIQGHLIREQQFYNEYNIR